MHFRRSPDIEIIRKAGIIFGLSVLIKEVNIVYALVVTASANNFSKCNRSPTSKRFGTTDNWQAYKIVLASTTTFFCK